MELFHLADAAEMMKCVFVGVRSESRIELNMTPSRLQLHNNHVPLNPPDSSQITASTAKTSMFYKTRAIRGHLLYAVTYVHTMHITTSQIGEETLETLSKQLISNLNGA